MFKQSISFKDYYNTSSLLFENPTFLLEEHYGKTALGYLPVDTGIEIECTMLPTFSSDLFNVIPTLVRNESSSDELRFRIPKGLDGFKCLWEICILLNKHCQKSLSGIHIHVDLTEHYDKISDNEYTEYASEFVLGELDTWGYKGTYNKRNTTLQGGWVRFQPVFKTMEIRICEMTFDYVQLSKRIVHCHYIRKNMINNYDIYEIAKYSNLAGNNIEPEDIPEILKRNKFIPIDFANFANI